MIGPLVEIRGSVREFSLPGLALAVLGAVILLGVVNLIQRGNVRYLLPFARFADNGQPFADHCVALQQSAAYGFDL